MLGLIKGVLADGVVSDDEAILLHDWTNNHPDATEQWPVNALKARLDRIFEDGIVADEERLELTELLQSIVGGTAGVIVGEDASTSLPVDTPPPQFTWNGSVFVFTGKFAFGTRKDCEGVVTKRGATCESTITKRTKYLIIGTFGSKDWVHTSFGRKIEKAVEYRNSGCGLVIAGEDHWAASIDDAT